MRKWNPKQLIMSTFVFLIVALGSETFASEEESQATSQKSVKASTELTAKAFARAAVRTPNIRLSPAKILDIKKLEQSSVTDASKIGVRDIKYEIFDPDPDVLDGEGNPRQKEMTYEAQLIWSNGSTTIKRGNVVPHLTGAEITGLQNLADRLRTKAETAWGDVP